MSQYMVVLRNTESKGDQITSLSGSYDISQKNKGSGSRCEPVTEILFKDKLFPALIKKMPQGCLAALA